MHRKWRVGESLSMESVNAVDSTRTGREAKQEGQQKPLFPFNALSRLSIPSVGLPLALPDSTHREMERGYAVALYAKRIPSNNVHIEAAEQPYEVPHHFLIHLANITSVYQVLSTYV